MKYSWYEFSLIACQISHGFYDDTDHSYQSDEKWAIMAHWS